MQEIWKDVTGYEGSYQVSNLGNVKSLKTGKQLYYCKGSRENNYLSVVFQKNKKRKVYYIHRLVAQEFIPNPNNYPVVNHLDCNTKNNRVDNLEWCTHKQNNHHGGRLFRVRCSQLLYYAMKDYKDNKRLIELLEEICEISKNIK